MKINLFLSVVIVVSFIASGFSGATLDTQASQSETGTITCYYSGVPQTATITADSAQYLHELFAQLAVANSQDPQSSETTQLQNEILYYAYDQNLLPSGTTPEQIQSQLAVQAEKLSSKDRHHSPLSTSYAGKGQEYLCNFISWGEGGARPIIILPRLIPILMIPIPRLYVGWTTDAGITSVGGLLSGTGFYVVGPQKGTALGFWGIGFSIFFPPFREYGMIGYALYAKVSSDNIEFYPPNNEPEVNAVYPLDGATYIPMSTTELQFRIQDLDKDLLSYSVTTSPDIGGGNGNMKPDGTYTIPVSNLQSSTTYSWMVQASDGKDTITRVYSFTTEYLAPQILDPAPMNGAYYVPLSLSSINFTLYDHQNDPIDWTLQTNPNIGSGSGTDVYNGRFNVPIQTSELQYDTTYTWYLNATDGTYWNRQVFLFKTIMEGIDPYIYAGGNGGKIVRISKEDMTKDAESASYGDGLRSLACDGQFLYTAGLAGEGTIWQLWPSNLTKRMESVYIGTIFTLEFDGTYLYAAGRFGSSEKVYQFWPSNLTKRLESAELSGTAIWALRSAGDYLYVVGGVDYSSGYLYQLRRSDLTVAQVTTVDSGYFWSIQVIDPYVFVGTSCTVDGGVIKQFRISDLTQVNSGYYGGTVYALAFDGTYLYAGGHDTQKVYKYWPSNLTKIAESENYGGWIIELAYDGDCLYAAGRSANKVWQLNTADLSLIQQTPNLGGDVEAMWTYPGI